jgi:hypothetical protein
MDPMNERRLRIDVEGGVMKSEVMAVVRPQHQAVAGEADWIAIGVLGRMHDADPGNAVS